MNAELKDLLEQKKAAITKKWFDAIVETYPAETSGFLKRQKDQFSNPVGHAITQGVESMFEALITDQDFSSQISFLEDIIKVRAIQDFTPAKAVGFIFPIKKAVRNELDKEIRQKQIENELVEFEAKVDDLALLAFNIYSQCREHLNNVKIEELKRMTYTLMKNANLMYDIPAQEFEQNEASAQEFEQYDLKFNL